MNGVEQTIEAILEGASVPDPGCEAGQILQAAAVNAPDEPERLARSMAEQRAAGVPLAYVTGKVGFMGIELLAAEGVLVPRAETELLGFAALKEVGESPSLRIIDVCCGAGNLACALAHYLPTARVWGTDLTDSCVALARRNADYVGVADRVEITQGDLFSGLSDLGLEGSIDLIVCNPPYVSQAKLAGASAALMQYEPREAFDGGPYGLSIHQRVIKEAVPFLRPGGLLMFEIGEGQDRQVRFLFERAKAYVEVSAIANSSGEARVVMGRAGRSV